MISIVIPAYNEERNLEPLYAKLREVLSGAGEDDFEVIFVDDGSTDRTWDAIAALSGADVRARGVRLSRNFGHQSALMAGLAAARGRAVVMMDADLQHPPSLVPQLVRKWREGFHIVHAVRRDPPNLSWFKRMTSRLYYRLFTFMSGVEIEPGSADFRLLDRQVVDEVLRFEEEGLFLRGLVHWVGYSTASVPFECGERHAGKSKYGLKKMLTLG
jgi:glycosyltransferase involved in cell wall biosynthesis